MSSEKFHPPSKEPEKNPNEGDGVRQMSRRAFLPIFAAFMASVPILGSCQKPKEVQTSSAKEPEPTAEPEVAKVEAKETEPKIVVEDLWPSFLIYPEGYKHGDVISPEVEKAWQERVTQLEQEIRQDPRFLELESTGMKPRTFAPAKFERGRNIGKIGIGVTFLVIE